MPRGGPLNDEHQAAPPSKRGSPTVRRGGLGTPSRHPRRTAPTLAEFLRAEMAHRDLNSSYALGKYIGVSQGTAWRLLSSPRIPREDTLAKIAAAFDVPRTEIRELAERPTGEPESFGWPKEFNQLNNRQRDALYEVGWTFLDTAAHRVTR